MRIQKGQLVLLTLGEYSDKANAGHFRALKDFDTADVAREFMASPQARDELDPEETYGCAERFPAWAMRQGYVSLVEPREIVTWWYARASYGSEVLP